MKLSAGRTWVAAAILAMAAAPAGAQSTGSPELTWYGYVKLDASWDQALVNSGNFARWVVSPDRGDDHAGFNMTARQTRLGFRARSQAGAATVSGLWEADFYAGSAENKNGLQVRHAYVNVVWPSGWEILAGQTSDVISPLVPTTLNYVVAWWAGNIGYRRPQLRVTRTVDLGGGASFVVRGAAARTIGDDFVPADPGDSGTASGVPTFQGLVGVSLPLGGRTLSLGASAHRGAERVGPELGGESVDIDSYSWGAYLELPLGPLTLSGEGWMGSHMDDYFGGIGQGLIIGENTVTAIAGRGGWSQLGWRSDRTRINLGMGIDDPDDVDLTVDCRSRNMATWLNVIRDYGGGLEFGLEYSYWHTQYKNLRDGTSSRVQGSVIYSF